MRVFSGKLEIQRNDLNISTTVPSNIRPQAPLIKQSPENKIANSGK